MTTTMERCLKNKTSTATSLRAMIKGVVANNRIGNSDYTLSSDEAGEGVTVGLYEVGAGKDKKKQAQLTMCPAML